MTDIHDFTYAVFEKSNITGGQEKVIEVRLYNELLPIIKEILL